MYRYLCRFLMSILFCFMATACATAPATNAPPSVHVVTAKRFVHSWGASDIAMAAFQHSLDNEAKSQPGMAELSRRVFANIKAEDFENIIARVYARHLTQDNLAKLTQFTESRTGNRFFRAAIAADKQGNKTDIMSQFNADELTEIMKFSQSDAFAAMKQALPTINRELADEGRHMAETAMRDYIKKQ